MVKNIVFNEPQIIKRWNFIYHLAHQWQTEEHAIFWGECVWWFQFKFDFINGAIRLFMPQNLLLNQMEL